MQCHQTCKDHKKKPKSSEFNHHRKLKLMKGYARPVATIENKASTKLIQLHISNHQKERLGAIQYYLHIKPSIGVGFKNFGRVPFIFPIGWSN